jgi:hypothetical protein
LSTAAFSVGKYGIWRAANPDMAARCCVQGVRSSTGSYRLVEEITVGAVKHRADFLIGEREDGLDLPLLLAFQADFVFLAMAARRCLYLG